MLNFNKNSIIGEDTKGIFNFEVISLNEKSDSPTPVEKYALKDVDGNYLYDSDNNKLFVRG